MQPEPEHEFRDIAHRQQYVDALLAERAEAEQRGKWYDPDGVHARRAALIDAELERVTPPDADPAAVVEKKPAKAKSAT